MVKVIEICYDGDMVKVIEICNGGEMLNVIGFYIVVRKENLTVT